MFNWFFNLFKAEDNQPLTRKADSEPNIQSKDYLSERDDLSNYLSTLKDQLESRIESEDNIVQLEDAKNNEELRTLYRYNISCKELALALRSKISAGALNGDAVPQEGIINMAGLTAIGPLSLIYSLYQKDSAMSNALDDALDISVYDYVLRLDWSKIPDTVKQLTKAFEGIPDATVEVMKQDPVYNKKYQGKSTEEILKQVNMDFTNNEIRKTVRREKAGRIPSRERENLANSPDVQKSLLKMQQEGKEYNAANMPAVSPTLKDYENASAAVLQSIDAVDKIATALNRNFVAMSKRQSVLLKPGEMAAALLGLQFDHSADDDNGEQSNRADDEKFTTKTQRGKEFAANDASGMTEHEKEQNARNMYNFEYVINRLQRAEGNTPQSKAAVALLANSLAEKSGIYDHKSGKNFEKRPLNVQKTALEELQNRLGLSIFDASDVNKIFNDVYNSYTVQDPNSEYSTISLEDYKVTVESLKLVLQALNILKSDSTDKRKRRRAKSTIMYTLEEFFMNEHPKADQFKRQIADAKEKLAALRKEDGDPEQIKKLEGEIESITEELAKYESGTNADVIKNLIEACREGKNVSGGNTGFAGTVKRQVSELLKTYEGKLQEYTRNANEKAKQMVVAAARKNETEIRQALINDPRLSNNETFSFAVKQHYADILNRIISASNTQNMLDFIEPALSKPFDQYYKDRPESNYYDVEQLATIYEGKYADELVKFTLWDTERFTPMLKEGKIDELKQHLKNVVTSAASKGTTESDIDEAVNSMLFSPAAFVSKVYDRNSLERRVAMELIRSSDKRILNEYKESTGCDVAPFKYEFNPKEAADILLNNTVVRELSDDFYAKVVAVRSRAEALHQVISDYDDVALKLVQRGFPSKDSPEYESTFDTMRTARACLENLRDARYELTQYMEDHEPDQVSDQSTLREANKALKDCDKLIDQMLEIEKKVEYAKSAAGKDAVEQMSNRVEPFTYSMDNLKSGNKEGDEEKEDGEYATIFPNQKVYVRDGSLFKVKQFGDSELRTITPVNKRPEEIVVNPKLWIRYMKDFDYGDTNDLENYTSNVLKNGFTDYFYVSDADEKKWFRIDLSDPEELGDPLSEKPNDAELIGDYATSYKALKSFIPKPEPEPEEEKEEKKERPASRVYVGDDIDPDFHGDYAKTHPIPREVVEKEREEDENKPNITEYTEPADENAETHNAGFSFFGIQKKAGTFRFMGFTKQAGDGLNAFTSDQDLQKAVENPFGDAMSDAEQQIHKQRAVSPDNTSNQGQTSIQQDQEEAKPFSSKQLIKAFKAAYEKDPGTFDDLLRLVSQSGATGTFAAEILGKLPEVNWVAEAALRKYNETAQQPVHRNSFQQALEKANEEQLSKNEMFVNICKNILNGKPA